MKGGYKYVKIPTDIFYKIARFLVTMDEGLHEEICEYYQYKLGKMHNHNLYSIFKTSENQEEMEDAIIVRKWAIIFSNVIKENKTS